MRTASPKRRNHLRSSGSIAQAHGKIAQPAFITDPVDRAARHAGCEIILRPGEQVGQVAGVEFVPRCEVRLGGQVCKSVPRACELAIVATVDAVADERTQGFRYGTLQLYGQIRDTAPGIDPVGRHDRPRRTGIDAGTAGAAMVCDGRIERKRKIGEYLPQEEVRTCGAVDQQGMLSTPARACTTRQFDLQDRRGIDEDPIGMRHFRRDPVCEFLQATTHRLVIIAPQRISRNVSLAPVREGLDCIRRPRPVTQAHADHAQGAWQQFRGSGPLHAVTRHIIHLAMEATLQPLLKSCFGIGEIHTCHCNGIEAEFPAPRAHPLRQGAK